jgi:hypothetical protein
VTGETGDAHPHHNLSLTFSGMVTRVRGKCGGKEERREGSREV